MTVDAKPKPTYSELLRDPRWQRKRLEIMQRDDFRCSECGAKDTTLNVHHGYYEKYMKPWEYPNETLHCLCEPCHVATTRISSVVKRELARHWTQADLYEVLKALQALKPKKRSFWRWRL